MVRILNLRLPAGYAADRHLTYIAVSLRGRQIGCLVPDIAPLDLEALVHNHHGAGGLGDLPRIGAVAALHAQALTGAVS